MNRRTFTKLLTSAAAGAFLWRPMGFRTPRARAAASRRVLGPETDLKSLIYEDPSQLDADRLPITPTDALGTMGLTAHPVDLEQWRLAVGGAVAAPLRLTYAEILDTPAIERNVLLICPGVFAGQARWRGVSLTRLLERAGAASEACAVEVSGPDGKRVRFPMARTADDSVILAYAVNGSLLPEPHGFPLRAVAEGRVGSEWGKFAERVHAVVAPPKEDAPATGPGPAYLP